MNSDTAKDFAKAARTRYEQERAAMIAAHKQALVDLDNRYVQQCKEIGIRYTKHKDPAPPRADNPGSNNWRKQGRGRSASRKRYE
jgi:hypothetical protein